MGPIYAELSNKDFKGFCRVRKRHIHKDGPGQPSAATASPLAYHLDVGLLRESFGVTASEGAKTR